MELKLRDIPVQIVPHVHNGEGDLHKNTFEDEDARIMLLTLAPGASIGRHTHTGEFEVYYGVSGRGKVLYEDAEETLLPGDCHYCPNGHNHSLINDGNVPLEVFAIVAKGH